MGKGGREAVAEDQGGRGLGILGAALPVRISHALLPQLRAGTANESPASTLLDLLIPTI